MLNVADAIQPPRQIGILLALFPIDAMLPACDEGEHADTHSGNGDKQKSKSKAGSAIDPAQPPGRSGDLIFRFHVLVCHHNSYTWGRARLWPSDCILLRQKLTSCSTLRSTAISHGSSSVFRA